MIDSNTIDRVIGSTAYDRDGDKIGKVGQVYVDIDNGRPLWASVHTGLFGMDESFVPLQDAEFTGDELRVPYEKDRIKDAPRVEADREINDEEQARLWEYYGVTGASSMSGMPGMTDAERGSDSRTDMLGDADYTAGTTGMGASGRDGSGHDTDSAMTRSEEQLNVDKKRVETGHARLRKHVVIENQTITVPVEREEVRIEREPITDANRDQAMSGPDFTEDEHDMILHEEQVTVEKKTVPVERVHATVETVTEDEIVSEQLRKEEIDLEKD
jgi:uncharacterized protein (TIGR02271 family)